MEDQIKQIVAEMRKESTDDHPMQYRGIPTVHSDIRRWADKLEELIGAQSTR